MLYRDRFRGHLDSADPRTVVTGGGGCPWPTVPPFRVQLSSTNATGEWAFLRTQPIILEQDPVISHHDHVTWQAIEMPPQVYRVLLEKIYLPVFFPVYRYWLTIILIGWRSSRVWVKNTQGRCNKDVYWGEHCRRPIYGTTGDQFRQYQVEFDKTRHPGWNPE